MPEQPEQQLDTTAYGRGLLVLLKEYAGKLDLLLEAVMEARDQATRAAMAAREQLLKASSSTGGFLNTASGRILFNRYTRLAPAIQELNRATSQLSLHGAIDELIQAELRIRRAEVESLDVAINTALNSALDLPG